MAAPDPSPGAAPSGTARRLLIGDGLSAFGAWIDFLAILTLAAWQLDVTPAQMALVSAAGLLPGILAGPAIGRWCDRGDPRRLLLGSLAARALATVALLSSSGLPAFLALVALRSVFATVAPPAIQVLGVRALPAEERPRFYSLLNVVNSAAKVLAPALGGLSASWGGESVALGVSAACSAAAMVVFWGLRVAPTQAPPAIKSAGSLAASSGEAGPATTSSAPLRSLAPLIWVGATWAFVVFMVNNLVPLVLQQAALDKSMLGVLVSCSGAGNIVSGLWLSRRGVAAAWHGRLREVVAPAAWQALGFGLIGALLAGGGGSTPWMLPAMFFLVGTLSARHAIALNVYLSRHHGATMGESSARLQAWQNTMILVAPLIGAVVLDRAGGAALFGFSALCAGVSYAALAAWRMRSRADEER